MLSYVLSFLTILGLYLVGRKNKYGFLVTFFSEFLWIYWISITVGAKGLYIACVVIMVISMKSYLRWNKDERK
jgi:apolipoprotein N-acyltransferase